MTGVWSIVSLQVFGSPRLKLAANDCPARGRGRLTHVHEQNEVGGKDCDDIHHRLERHQVGQLVNGEVELQKEVEQEKPA